jgi:hypothetical protein
MYVLWTLCGYCSLNTFNPYKLLWPQYRYCIWGGKFHGIYANVAAWIPSIDIGYCDPNVGIAFKKEISKLCFMNSMQVLQFQYINPYMLLWLQCGYCIWGGKILCVFCELYVGIALCGCCIWAEKNPMCVLWTLCGYCNLYTFNLVVNKHWECKYHIFCICEFFCLWKYFRIIKHAYKKWFWI